MADICNLLPLNGTVSLTSTASSASYSLHRKADLLINECFVEVTTNVSGTVTAPVVSLAINGAVVATKTIVSGTAAPQGVSFDLPNNNAGTRALQVGDQVTIACQTAAAGSPAGAVRALIAFK